MSTDRGREPRRDRRYPRTLESYATPEEDGPMLFARNKTDLVGPEDALRGRSTPMEVPERHFVNGNRLTPPFPQGYQQAVFGMGCFWGAERVFWRTPGVWTTAVGYAGGGPPNPTHPEGCSTPAGPTRIVPVVF